MNKLLLTTLVLLTSLFLISCDDEINDVAQAQECLNNLSDANHDQAINCFSYVSGRSSSQAKVLKCSIYLTYGGLTASRMITAYSTYNDDTNPNAEGQFMMALIMEDPTQSNDATEAQSLADTASSYCRSTGDPGLTLIGELAAAGTAMAAVIPGSINFDDPSGETGDFAAAEIACDGDATCEASVGNAAITIADSYCVGDREDESICQDIEAAVANGSDAQSIGEYLLNLLE